MKVDNSNDNLPGFLKIESQGNSYIYFDFRGRTLPEIDLKELSQRVADKNFGIGSDGMVIILEDEKTDAAMRIFNADGSEAMFCGSALKAVVAMLTTTDMKKKKYRIRTNSGVTLGEVISGSAGDYYVSTELQFLKKSKINVQGIKSLKKWQGIPVDVGNPHFVIFDRDQESDSSLFCLSMIGHIGPIISNEPAFIDGINVEMVEIESSNKVKAAVWERGSGETLACGSGAMAIVLAGMNQGYLAGEVEVIFPGGSKFVDIDLKTKRFILAGEVRFICSGQFFI